MGNAITHFFADHVIATILVIVFVLFMFTRGGGGILGSWIVRIVLFVMIAVWIWIALMSYLDSLWRDANQKAQEASNFVSDHTPQWVKDLWQEIRDKLPSPKEKAVDKICEYMEISLPCNIAKAAEKNLGMLKQDIATTEKICKDSPAVEQRFGAEAKVQYCAGGVFSNAQRAIDAIGKGAVEGATGMLSGLLVTDTSKLDKQDYLDCLYTHVAKVQGANASSCKYSDSHTWRLCVEFHMQLPHEQLGQPPAPLDPNIAACRTQALGL